MSVNAKNKFSLLGSQRIVEAIEEVLALWLAHINFHEKWKVNATGIVIKCWSIEMKHWTAGDSWLETASSALFHTFRSKHSAMHPNLKSVIWLRLRVVLNSQYHGVFSYILRVVLRHSYDVSTDTSHLNSCTHSPLHLAILNPGTSHSLVWVVRCVTYYMHPVSSTWYFSTINCSLCEILFTLTFF